MKVLTYHVVSGKLMAADVVKETELTTVEGGMVKVTVTDGKVFLNDDTEIIITDIEASNGVIHAIDTVLMPPKAEEAQNIVQVAQGDDRFSTLVSALVAGDLVSTLEGEGPFTVFAPTNDAFDKVRQSGL